MKLFILGAIFCAAFAAHAAEIPHLDPETTGEEYANYLKHHHGFSGGAIQTVIDTGTRNLDWLKYMNQYRDQAHKMSFTSAATQKAYPIEAPNKYNEQIAIQQYNDLLAKLPSSIKDVLLNKKEFTQDPPVDEAEYLDWGLQMERVYETAARWLTMEPYLYQLTFRRQGDVRGYYFLNKEADLQTKLTGFDRLDQATQDRLKDNLVGLCFNTEGDTGYCTTSVTKAIQAKQVWPFYNQYLAVGQKTWNEYFVIDDRRDDITWPNAQEMHVPFQTPPTPELQNFLSTNIQDEWRFGDWKLILDFKTDAETHMVMEAGATPHVNGLGGNEITMDFNQPLTDYNVQWTIRHEYGHTLGFPDCYVEFYDETEKVMINYQLDITNLMCSRRGHILQSHVDELQRVYARK